MLNHCNDPDEIRATSSDLALDRAAEAQLRAEGYRPPRNGRRGTLREVFAADPADHVTAAMVPDDEADSYADAELAQRRAWAREVGVHVDDLDAFAAVSIRAAVEPANEPGAPAAARVA